MKIKCTVIVASLTSKLHSGQTMRHKIYNLACSLAVYCSISLFLGAGARSNIIIEAKISYP